jgi:AcrR family transcriptional regulator
VPAELRTSRERWVNEGMRALAAGGPEAVKVELLARRLGVTKGGFYGQFADRDELLAEVLDTWERECTDEVVERVEREGGDTAVKVWRAGALTFSSDRLLPVDLAVRDWARHDPAVAARLRRVDNRRMDYLRKLFGVLLKDPADIEARSLLAFALVVGTHYMSVEHGPVPPQDARGRAMALLMSGEPAGDGQPRK